MSLLYTHAVCRTRITQRTVCAHCGRVDDPAEIQATIGPGLPPERIPRQA